MKAHYELFLARHGHATADMDESGLSAAGTLDASALAWALRYSQVVEIWHSPLRRAKETAQITARFMSTDLARDVRMIESDLLSEGPRRSDAENVGVSPETIRTLAWRGARRNIHEGGRDTQQVMSAFLVRCAAAWTALQEAVRMRGPIAVIAHGGILNGLILRALETSGSDFVFDFECGAFVCLQWEGASLPTLRFLSSRTSGPVGIEAEWTTLEGTRARRFDERLGRVRSLEAERHHQRDMYSRPLHVRRLEYVEFRLSKIVRDQTVLEIGSAEGQVCGLAKLHGASRVMGVECSLEKVARARTEHANCEFLVGDFLQWNPGLRFDVVLALEFFQHVRDYRRALSLALSALNPGGTFLVSIPCRSLGFHKPAQLSEDAEPEDLLADIGGAGFGRQNALWSFDCSLFRDEVLSMGDLTLVHEHHLGAVPWPGQPERLAQRVFCVLEFAKVGAPQS